MGGLDLLSLLRATYSRDDLPVILVTGVDQAENLVEVMHRGANDYVVKPGGTAGGGGANRSAVVAGQVGSRNPGPGTGADARRGRPGTRRCWDWDLVDGTMRYSPRWLAILGYAEGAFRPLPEEWLTRLHPDDEARVREELRELIEHHAPGETGAFSSEHRICNQQDIYQWVQTRGTVARGKDGRPLHLTGWLTDIVARKGSDPLTGLGNRLSTVERIESAMKAQKAVQGSPERTGKTGGGNFALLVVDLDGFNLLNDSFGHHTGDRILCEAAARLQAVVAEAGLSGGCLDGRCVVGKSLVSRIAADEFTVLLDGLESPLHARIAAEGVARGVLERIAQPTSIHGFQVPVSASVGVTVGSSETARAEDVIGDTELAMYCAKELGTGRCVMFEPHMREGTRTSSLTAHELRRAIDNRQLEAFYQPKIHLKTRAIIGFEALLRWNHPKRGLIQPNDFIPLAEETGLIVPMGEWILEQACCQLKSWQNMFRSTPPLSMNVNLSVKQLSDPHLVPWVRTVLDKTGVVPGSLKLELTESGRMIGVEDAKHTIASLRAMDVGLKLDDFGTGYSSLSHLGDLRFDALKIDRSFVARMSEDAESHAIVETMIKLALAMKMDVVAEGIEEERQLNELIRLGCETGQGFYFSKPVEASKAEKLLQIGFAAGN